MAEVRVFARAKAKAGKEEAARELFLELVKKSRTEDGADFYELFESKDGGEFLFSEQYGSPEEFEAHKSSDHFQQAMAIRRGIPARMRVGAGVKRHLLYG